MQGAVGTIVFSLWLPVLVLVISFVRFSGDWIVEGPGVTGILWLVGLAWPAAIPLTLGVRRILRRSHRLSRILGYGCAVVLGLVSAWGVIVGGLFGPIGVVLYPLVASLPAWIILRVLPKDPGGVGGQASAA